MADREHAQWLVPTRGAHTLPAIEILTGRGFITGKSGSGKSNTASVIAEELLASNYNLLIVDPEGEYYGLKEKFEILHVGNDDICDMQATPADAEELADLALNQNTPVILDVSDYLDRGKSRELIANTVRELFRQEKSAQMPFLLMIEEMQEYLPQQGGTDELSEVLERVAKRGRKRGLGMLGMSQRPSSVDKDFITQCDWMVWHRLTWQNDIKVVTKVLGSEYADEIENLDTGEGFLMTDWDEELARVTFKRKQTHDAGATPGLDRYTQGNSSSDDPSGPTPESSDVGSSQTGEEPTAAPDPAGDPSEPDGPDPVAQDPSTPAVDAEATADGDATGPGAVFDILRPAAGDQSDRDTAVPTTDGPARDDADPTAAAETDATALPDLEVDAPVTPDIEALDEAELRECVATLRRENQILSDEVAELRSILGTVDVAGSNEKSTADESGAGVDAAAEAADPEASRAGARGVETADTRPGPAPNRPGTPAQPVPPEPPENRRGIAGNLVELVFMVGYLLRSLLYRCRLLTYRLRYGHRYAGD